MLKSMVVGAVVVASVAGNPAHGMGADEPGASGEVVQKRYHWQAGMTTYYRMVSTNDMTMGEGTDARPSHGAMAILARQEVYSVKDDGTGRVALTFVRVRKEDEKGTEKTVFDSADPEKSNDEVTGKTFGAIVGRTVIFEMTPEGRLLRQEGVEKLVEAMFGGLESAGGEEAKARMAKFMEPMKKVLKQNLEPVVAGMAPGSAVGVGVKRRIGEEWTSEQNTELPMVGPSKGSMKYKIDSVELVDGRRIATTSSVSEQDLKPNMDFGKLFGDLPSLGANVEAHVEHRGIEVFDLDRGRLVRSESNMKSAGTMTMSMPDFQDKTAAPKKETRKFVNTVRTVTELVGPEEPILPGVR